MLEFSSMDGILPSGLPHFLSSGGKLTKRGWQRTRIVWDAGVDFWSKRWRGRSGELNSNSNRESGKSISPVSTIRALHCLTLAQYWNGKITYIPQSVDVRRTTHPLPSIATPPFHKLLCQWMIFNHESVSWMWIHSYFFYLSVCLYAYSCQLVIMNKFGDRISAYETALATKPFQSIRDEFTPLKRTYIFRVTARNFYFYWGSSMTIAFIQAFSYFFYLNTHAYWSRIISTNYTFRSSLPLTQLPIELPMVDNKTPRLNGFPVRWFPNQLVRPFRA